MVEWGWDHCRCERVYWEMGSRCSKSFSEITHDATPLTLSFRSSRLIKEEFQVISITEQSALLLRKFSSQFASSSLTSPENMHRSTSTHQWLISYLQSPYYGNIPSCSISPWLHCHSLGESWEHFYLHPKTPSKISEAKHLLPTLGLRTWEQEKHSDLTIVNTRGIEVFT